MLLKTAQAAWSLYVCYTLELAGSTDSLCGEHSAPSSHTHELDKEHPSSMPALHAAKPIPPILAVTAQVHEHIQALTLTPPQPEGGLEAGGLDAAAPPGAFGEGDLAPAAAAAPADGGLLGLTTR